MVIAIITARGGSKRIPRKNIRNFLGYPIIKYPIDAALNSGCFDEVMVSTEDQEIANISKSLGASVPFMRSKKTSGDHSTTEDVVEEVLLEYKKRLKNINLFCILYPTAPFVTPERIKESYKLFLNSGADSLVPVVRFSYPIQRAQRIDRRGKLKMIWPKYSTTMSQDLPATYHDAGQFYWMKTEPFFKQHDVFSKNTLPYEIPETEVQDIDNEEDWKLAEMKFRLFRNARTKN